MFSIRRLWRQICAKLFRDYSSRRLLEAEALLRECEWAYPADQIYHTVSCPVCEGLAEMGGHEPDCRLKKFLDD